MSAEDIIEHLTNGSYECSVCSDAITFHDSPQLWWCERCFQILHRNCAKKWAVAKTTPFQPQNQNAATATANNNTITSLLPNRFPQQQRERPNPPQAAVASASPTDASASSQSFSCPNCRASLKDSSDPTLDLLISRKSGCGCYCGRVPSQLKADPSLLPGSCGEPCPRDVIMRKRVKRQSAEEQENSFYFCNHPCPLLCHPGLQCPPCKAIRTMKCRCGRGQPKQVVCGDFRGQEFYSCGEVCGAAFPCGKHKCQEICHSHRQPSSSSSSKTNNSCGIQISLKCGCGKTEKKFPCPGPENSTFVCGNVCGKKLSCGRHSCDLICCEKSDQEHQKQMLCDRDPKNPNVRCNCGKTKISEIAATTMKKRNSCADPLPGCAKKICGKQLACGKEDHVCTKPCHDENEPCDYCFERVTLSCRCGKGLRTFDSFCFVSYVPQERWEQVLEQHQKEKSSKNNNNNNNSSTNGGNNNNNDDDDDFSQYFVPSASRKGGKKQQQQQQNNNNKNQTEFFGNFSSHHKELPPTWPLLCTTKCNKLLSCGKHKCEIVCCNDSVSDDHFCPRVCKKLLGCRQHECNAPCHGNAPCLECPNTSYEPLFCTCGKTVIDPPIRCGTLAPSCNHPCAITHPEGRTCGHDNIGPRRENVHACHSLATPCPPCMAMVAASCYSHREPLDWLVPCYKATAVACARKCGKRCFKCVNWRDGAGGTCDKICHDLEKGMCVCSKCKKEFAGLEVPSGAAVASSNNNNNSNRRR